MKTGSRLAMIVFVLVAVAHLLRLIFDTDVIIGSWNMPLWISVLGTVVPAGIAWLLWKER